MIRGYLSPGLVEYLRDRALVVTVSGDTLLHDRASGTWISVEVERHEQEYLIVATSTAPMQQMYDLASTNAERRPVMEALLKTAEQRKAEQLAAKRERKAARRARRKDLVTLGKLFEGLVTSTSAFDLDPGRSNGHLRYWSRDGFSMGRFLSAEECDAVRRIPGRP